MTVTTPRRRFGALALCISLLAVVASACGGGGSSSSKVPSGDVAKVDTVAITQTQFDQLMSAAKASYKANKKKFPAVGSAEYATVRQQAVTELVQEAEISIGAKDLSISVSDADVEKALNTIKKQYFSDTKTKKYDPKKYAAALKAQNTTDARVRDQLRQKLLADKITAKLTKGITVTPAAITAYYAKNKSQFAVPAQRHVRHILVKTKAQAEKLYAQLKTSDKHFAGARQEVLDRHDLGGQRRRPEDDPEGPDGADVRCGRLQGAGEPGLGARQVDLRLPPDRGARPGHARDDAQARRDAQGDDQDAAHGHRQAEEDQQLAERRQGRSLEEDRVRDRATRRPR